jgi:hypothetical protein
VTPLAGAQGHAPTYATALVGDLERKVAAQDQHLPSVLGIEAERSSVAHAGPAPGVVGPRIVHDLQRHLAFGALDHAQDFVIRDQQPALVVLAAHRHEIDEPHGTVVGAKRRLQHRRVAEVAARGSVPPGGSDSEPAAKGWIEQGGEQGRAVEPGPAKPVDGAVAGNEGCRSAVPDDGVVANGRRFRRCS